MIPLEIMMESRFLEKTFDNRFFLGRVTGTHFKN